MTENWMDVTAADGGKFRAYLALPPAGKGPGIPSRRTWLIASAIPHRATLLRTRGIGLVGWTKEPSDV